MLGKKDQRSFMESKKNIGLIMKITDEEKHHRPTHFSIRSFVSSSIVRALSEDEDIIPKEPSG